MRPSERRFLLAAAVMCAGCEPVATQATRSMDAPDQYRLTLAWNAATDPTVAGFRVYVAGSADGAGELLTSVEQTAAGFDQAAPQLVLETADDATLAELVGSQACFRITALDAEGAESERTEAACVDL